MKRLFRNWWFVTITCAVLVALLLALGLPLFVKFPAAIMGPYPVRRFGVRHMGAVRVPASAQGKARGASARRRTRRAERRR